MTGSATGGEVETGTWEQLPWDSAFFDVAIGRIRLDAVPADRLADAEADARAAGVRCLYGELDPADVATVDLVQRRGYRLMEVALDLDHATSALVSPPPTAARVRVGDPGDLEALHPQLVAVAPWSRYAVDPRFGCTAALALHRAWAERAAGGRDGRALLVAEDDTGVTGLATVGADPDGAHRIDLIASTRPRSGAAQALVAAAFAGFGPGPSRGGPIAARNVASLRFSEQMGYRIARSRYVFHRWLDEGAEAPGAQP